MGQGTSQLEAGDLDVYNNGQSRSQSPDEQSQRRLENEYNSEQGSPQPFAHDHPSSQDFAFSSQVPQTTSRSRHVPKSNRRRSKSKFERSSASPEPRMEPAHEIEEAGLDQQAPTPKPAKKKRDRKKKQSLAVGIDEPDTMPITSEPNDDIRPFEPNSSIDFDAVSSPAADESMLVDDSGLNDTFTAESTQLDPEELRRLEKRERKERKKAKKAAKQAEQLRSSLLSANPNFGAHNDPDASEEVREARIQNEDIKEEGIQVGDSHNSSHKTRNTSRPDADSVMQYSLEGEQEGDDTHVEDPNQLPTPDDDMQHDSRPPIPTFSQHSSPDIALADESAVQPSQRKRKARDSDKKSRKRRREQTQQSDENNVKSEIPTSINADGAANINTSDSQLLTKQSSRADSPIGEVTRDYFSQRYASQNSTPAKSNAGHVSNQELNLLDISPGDVDDSPSFARLRRQRVSSRSASPRRLVREEGQEEEAGVHAESMDIDGAEDELDNESHAAVDNADSMADNPMADLDDQEHYGSDDLGVEPTVEGNEDQEISEIPESPIASERPMSESNVPTTTKKSAKSIRQYGSKASTSKKRKAKTSYLERSDADNVQRFAELPSPAAAVVSRKGKARAEQTKEPTTVGPSKSVQGSQKQPKITSLMGGGSGAEPTSTSGSSKRPAPTLNSIGTVSKKVSRMKDPKPAEELTGPFTDEEKRSLDEAIKQWRKDYDLSETELNDMVQKNPQQAKTHEFWDHVRDACPNRKRQKVINQVRKTYHNFTARGSWTDEQHAELAAHYQEVGKNYAELGRRINRLPEDVRDRVRNYIICGDARKTDAWTPDEEVQLVAVMDQAFERIRQIREDEPELAAGQDDEDLVDWISVSENMGFTRSRLQCRSKWKQIKSRMEGGNIDGKVGHSMEEIIQSARDDVAKMESADLYKIAKAIKKSGYKADSRIGWQKLRDQWTAMEQWNRPALMLAWYRLRRSIPDWKLMSVPEVAQYWIDRYRQTNEINLIQDTELDLDAEYNDIEHKVAKIVGYVDRAKTPHLTVESDDDEAHPQSDAELGDITEQDRQEETLESEPEGDGSKTQSVADGKIAKSQPKRRSQGRTPRSVKKPRLISEQSPEAQDEDSRHTDLEQASKKSKKAGRGAAQPRSQSTKSRKSKLSKQALSDERVVEGVSSDTDADDVEDIPAVLLE